MKRNSRLSLALHSLSHMAGEPDRLQTSSEIAHHAGTNAVVVRRVLGKLRKAGLLISEKGHAGGWKLSRNPKDITLADIYTALDEQLVPSPAGLDAPDCSVEKALQHRVAHILADVEKTLVQRLATTTLAELGQPL
ncbi:MAG: Rrf2 family transcriptional regulator [Pseudomonadota bacterium]